MTKNQIEYLKYKETQRANLRQEELTAARDATSRELGFGTLEESKRHNQATEAHNTAVLGETQRHNYAQEAYNVAVLGEQTRHNYATEGIQRDTLAETQRANIARETETNRHNVASEQLSQQQLEISLGQLEVSRGQLEVSRGQLAETNRSNLAREAESRRTNLANEAIKQGQLEVSQGQLLLSREQLQELSRYHSASISLGYSQLAETQRANTMHNQVQLAQLAETTRAHIANENLTKARDKMNYEEQVRSNLAREEETTRHNMTLEAQGWESNEIRQDQIKLGYDQLELDWARLEEQKVHNFVTEGTDIINTGSKLIPLFIGG